MTGSSSNSSKYFASNDSSDTSRKARKSQDAPERSGFDKRMEDSLWTMIQHTPEPVMMTYQIRPRYRSPGRPVGCVSVSRSALSLVREHERNITVWVISVHRGKSLARPVTLAEVVVSLHCPPCFP